MRTTVVLDDELFRQAKLRAAETGQTLSDVISASLRQALSQPAPGKARRFRMPTFGGSSRQRHEPRDLALALEEEDRAQARR